MSDTVAELNASLIGRYLVERQIGQGGMATVYLARDVRHDRKVAVKVLHPELAAVLGPERFVTEMKVTANLQHPHILPLFDSGTARGQLFYVMPFVAGESLRDRLGREQQLPIDDAIRIASEVAGALDYAHRHGVVHRDIKPENILLHDGSALVADFGIALAVSNAGGARLTQTGLSLGTPQYMSPEQATGDRNVDGRTDVYSLGCVLYEMLAGEPPFTGPNSQAIVARVLTETVRPVRARRDTVSPAIDAAVMKAVQKLPADRFATPQAFADALRASDRASAIVTAPGAVVRRRTALVWPAIATVAVAAALWFGLHRPPGASELRIARQLTFDGNVTLAAISPDGNSLAYVTDDCLGQARICNQTLRVRDVDGTRSVAIGKSWPSIHAVKWSPDGTMLAISGSPDTTGAGIYLTDKLGGSMRHLAIAASAIGFTADSRTIAATTGGLEQTLYRYDVASLAPIDSVPLHVGWVANDLAFAPDGTHLVINAEVAARTVTALFDRNRMVDSISTIGRDWIRWTDHGTALLEFEFGPGMGDNLVRVPVHGDRIDATHARIVLGQVETGFQGVLDVATNGRVAIVVNPTSHELALHAGAPATPWRAITERTGYMEPWSIAPDGQSIVSAATDNLSDNIVSFPFDSGAAPTTITALRGPTHEFPAWSPDGKRLLYMSWHGTVPVVALTPATGGAERAVITGRQPFYTWASNDAVLLLLPDSIEVVDTLGKQRSTFAIPPGSAPSEHSWPVKDPARSRVAYWSDAASGLVLADLDHHGFTTIAHHQSRLLPLGWTTNGTVLVQEDDDATSTERRRHIVAIGLDGRSTDVIDLPPDCISAVVDTDARHIVCRLQHGRPDVWLADKAGKSGW